MISDIGGLLEGLLFFGKVFVGIFTIFVGNPMNRFLVDSLFKSEIEKLDLERAKTKKADVIE